MLCIVISDCRNLAMQEAVVKRVSCLVAGTNCCYVDQLSNIGKFHVNFRHLSRTSDMVINTVRSEQLLSAQCTRCQPTEPTCLNGFPRRDGAYMLALLIDNRLTANYRSLPQGKPTAPVFSSPRAVPETRGCLSIVCQGWQWMGPDRLPMRLVHTGRRQTSPGRHSSCELNPCRSGRTTRRGTACVIRIHAFTMSPNPNPVRNPGPKP